MIKAIIFDVDGVLLDSFEANFELFVALMEKGGYSTPDKAHYATLFHRTLRDTVQILTGSNDEAEIKRVCDLIDEIDQRPPLFSEGVSEVITRLSESYMLAIVTSRIKAYVYEPPLNTLEHYFKAAVAFEDTENHKPHPEPLFLAAQQLGVKPEECVYVGDAKSDMEAAQAAGMKFIWFGQDAPGAAKKFREIPGLIQLSS